MAPRFWKLRNLQERNSFECLSSGSLLLTQQEGPLRGSHNVHKSGVHKCLSQFEAPFPSSDCEDDISQNQSTRRPFQPEVPKVITKVNYRIHPMLEDILNNH